MPRSAPAPLPPGYTRRRLLGRIIVIAVVLLAAALKPQFDRWTGAAPDDPVAVDGRPAAGDQSSSGPVPIIVGESQQAERSGDGEVFLDATNTSASQRELPVEAAGTSEPSARESVESSAANQIRGPPGRLSLVAGTKDEFVSSAGLRYVPGSADQHRLKHVLKHASDIPEKRVHGVFDGDREQILERIDLAWLKHQNDSPAAQSQKQGNRTAITVDLKRKIGYVGGRRGAEQNYPACRYLKLVVQNRNEVVTAYPVDRW